VSLGCRTACNHKGDRNDSNATKHKPSNLVISLHDRFDPPDHSTGGMRSPFYDGMTFLCIYSYASQ
ncbi:MAG TPA: hypothetical protein V6C78_12060, partial [Crinalium sp.]